MSASSPTARDRASSDLGVPLPTGDDDAGVRSTFRCWLTVGCRRIAMVPGWSHAGGHEITRFIDDGNYTEQITE